MSTPNNNSCKLECKMCGNIYKRHSSFVKHEKSIQDVNVIKSTIYDLSEEAIEETWKSIVYHIKKKD